jgi:hypothetical protein
MHRINLFSSGLFNSPGCYIRCTQEQWEGGQKRFRPHFMMKIGRDSQGHLYFRSNEEKPGLLILLSLSVAIIACNRACGCAGCRTQFCSLFVLLITEGKNSAAPITRCSSHTTIDLFVEEMLIQNESFGLQV